MCIRDSSTTVQPPHHQQQTHGQGPGGYPSYTNYEMFADPRWMMQQLSAANYSRGTTGRDCPPPYNGGGGVPGGLGVTAGGRLVGNAAPSPARRATVEYRVQPSMLTTSTPSAEGVAGMVQPGVYPTMDYLNFAAAALPFQTAAAAAAGGVYAKQNY